MRWRAVRGGGADVVGQAHLALQLGAHLDEEGAVGARDREVARSLEVLAQAELHVEGQAVVLHEDVQIVHRDAELGVGGSHHGEHLHAVCMEGTGVRCVVVTVSGHGTAYA